MSTYSAPVLNSVTLPDPFEYQEFAGVRGAVTTVADGTTRWQLLQSGAKKRFLMRWRNLTSAQKTVLETALLAASTASKTLVAPDGESYTVILDQGSEEVEFKAVTKSSSTGPTYRDIVFETNAMVFREV